MRKNILSIGATLLIWGILSFIIFSLKPADMSNVNIYILITTLAGIFAFIVPIILVSVRKKMKIHTNKNDALIVFIGALLFQLLHNFPLLSNGLLLTDVLYSILLPAIIFAILFMIAEKMMNKRAKPAA